MKLRCCRMSTRFASDAFCNEVRNGEDGRPRRWVASDAGPVSAEGSTTIPVKLHEPRRRFGEVSNSGEVNGLERIGPPLRQIPHPTRRPPKIEFPVRWVCPASLPSVAPRRKTSCSTASPRASISCARSSSAADRRARPAWCMIVTVLRANYYQADHHPCWMDGAIDGREIGSSDGRGRFPGSSRKRAERQFSGRERTRD